jgi:hypothetical protein
MEDEMSARETGDSVCKKFYETGGRCNMRAVARFRGLRIETTVLLGLTPQALCCCPLTRAG